MATFSLETNSGGKIDVGTFTLLTNLFTNSFIKEFTVVADDLTNGKFPVSYTVSVTPKGRVA